LLPPAPDVELPPRPFAFVAAHHAPFASFALYAGFQASVDVAVPSDTVRLSAVDGDHVQVPVVSFVAAVAPSFVAAPFVAVALDGAAASAFVVPTAAPEAFAAAETAAAEVAVTAGLSAVATAAGIGSGSVVVA
jgi:hypothetical protein